MFGVAELWGYGDSKGGEGAKYDNMTICKNMMVDDNMGDGGQQTP